MGLEQKGGGTREKNSVQAEWEVILETALYKTGIPER